MPAHGAQRNTHVALQITQQLRTLLACRTPAVHAVQLRANRLHVAKLAERLRRCSLFIQPSRIKSRTRLYRSHASPRAEITLPTRRLPIEPAAARAPSGHGDGESACSALASGAGCDNASTKVREARNASEVIAKPSGGLVCMCLRVLRAMRVRETL